MSRTIAAPITPKPVTKIPSRRLLSLDALRGFDMFWIVGGEEIVHALYKAWPSGPLHLLDAQMDHTPWAGVTFYDLIFPLFVFMVGASMVFSLPRLIETEGRAAAFKRIFFRSLLLYLIGLFFYGGLSKGLEGVRWMGVLQRIALSYFFASLIFCMFRLRGILVAWAVLLLGYWAIMSNVPIRDIQLTSENVARLARQAGDNDTAAYFENKNSSNASTIKNSPAWAGAQRLFYSTTNYVVGKFDQGYNVSDHFDFQHLPGKKWDIFYDPEGYLSTIPAICTCLFGVFVGLLLKNSNVPDQKKVIYLVGMGIAAVALGFLWGLKFPVIKKIWTSSYVLVAGGYACLGMAAFYQMIEIWGWRKWCVPFVWIGMNPITIYLVFNLVAFDEFADRILGGPVKAALGGWGLLAINVLVVAMMFAFVRFLYKRQIFLRL
jgi:predicted acyltransferase